MYKLAIKWYLTPKLIEKGKYNMAMLENNASNECTKNWIKEGLDKLTENIKILNNNQSKDIFRTSKYNMIAILLANGFIESNKEWFTNNFKFKTNQALGRFDKYCETTNATRNERIKVLRGISPNTTNATRNERITDLRGKSPNTTNATRNARINLLRADISPITTNVMNNNEIPETRPWSGRPTYNNNE